jgi:hypothetical protein
MRDEHDISTMLTLRRSQLSQLLAQPFQQFHEYFHMFMEVLLLTSST